MDKSKIKNIVAFKEVLKNNGYTINETESYIQIIGNKNQYAYITEKESDSFSINLMGKEIDADTAIKIINELNDSIGLIKHIEFATNK